MMAPPPFDWPVAWRTYRHYKGDLYVVLAVGHLSNTEAEGEVAVVYLSVNKRTVWVRTLNGVDGWNTPTADGQTRFAPAPAHADKEDAA